MTKGHDKDKTRRQRDKLAIAIGKQAKNERKDGKKVQLCCEQDFLFGSLRNRFSCLLPCGEQNLTLNIMFQCLKQLQKIRSVLQVVLLLKKEKVAEEVNKHFQYGF